MVHQDSEWAKGLSYVKCETVECYLHRRAPIEEFGKNGNVIQTHPVCYVMRMDGAASELSEILALQ